MQFDTLLPENFDGVFRFTNPSDEDFVGKWDSKEYTYPAQKTTPMIILNATPLEVQNIRKKFARDLATREFFKSQQYNALMRQEKNADGTVRLNSIHQAAQYSDNDLKEYIQKCLTPMPVARPAVVDAPREDVEEKLSRTPKGKLRTRVLDGDESLVEQAKGANGIE